MIRDPQEAGALVEETVRGVYKKYYAETAEHYTQEMQLPENWFTNSDSVGDWVGNAAVATVNYIPQLAAQSGITVATGGVSALAFIYGVNGYYDIRDNYPEMSEEEAVAYGVGVALINGMLEKVTLGIIDGKVSKKVAEEGIKKGLLQAARHFGWNMTKEGAAEGMEEFSQNILDIVMGLRGDVSQWSGEDYRRELFRNVPESAFIGGISASPFAANSYRNYREIATRHETERAMIRDEIARLEGKSELSESEEVALAISKQAGYSVVYPARPDVEADVRLTLHIPKATREGAWQNVVISWPGSLFFTPAWLGYRYDVTTEVTCDLVSGATGEHLQTLRFPIALVLRHADFGRTWVNCWWAGIFALPNGFYCVTYDTDIDDEMPRDVFPMLGGHMATAIIRAVNSLPWESPNR